MEEKIDKFKCKNVKSGHEKTSQAKIKDKQQIVQKYLQILLKGLP